MAARIAAKNVFKPQRSCADHRSARGLFLGGATGDGNFCMSDDIDYNKTFDLIAGRAVEVAPGVRAIVANNPGPFTFKGTVSYIIGHGNVAILDPGPDDDAHIAALLDAVRGETVTHIFVTHTHRDHSPAVPKVKAATGAAVYAEGPHRLARPLHVGEAGRLDASADLDFRPDIALADGSVVPGDGWTVEALTTPGHTANHMAYALKEADLIFSGDHVMAWSTSIVAPPDGAMSDYMASLEKLAKRKEPIYLPGHGGPVRDAPRFVQGYIRHRHGREASICGGSKKAPPIFRRWCGPSTSASTRVWSAPPRCQSSRTWKTWPHAAWSRPKVGRRSAALIA